jgi:thioredoxin reductase
MRASFLVLFVLFTILEKVIANEKGLTVVDDTGCADPKSFEAIVIGAGPAGLQASLTLGRSMVKTLVLHADKPRNWMVKEFHNFIGHDGENPAAFRKTQIATIRKKYGEFVTFVQDEVTSITGTSGNFVVKTQKGEEYTAWRIVLALGVKEDIPQYPKGYASLYYESLFQCPFCHGIEERGKSAGVLSAPMIEGILMLKAWFTDLIFFTNGTKPAFLDETGRSRLADLNIKVEETPIVDLEVKENKLNAVVLEDGRRIERQVIYQKFKTHQHDIVASLKLDLDPMGNVKIHPIKAETSFPGIFAGGDMTTMFHQVAIAVGTGFQSAAFASQDITALRENNRLANKKESTIK